MAVEENVFTVKAQPYTLSSQSWESATSNIISVGFWFDPSDNTTRIVAMDGGVAKINSPITPGMTFLLPSHTFGQWFCDVSQVTHGLNFTSVQDARQFADCFADAAEGRKPTVKDGAAQPAMSAPAPGMGASPDAHGMQQPKQEQVSPSGQVSSLTSSFGGMHLNQQQQQQQQQQPQQPQQSVGGMVDPATDARIKELQAQVNQLTMDNQVHVQAIDKLKKALAENTANANLWQSQVAQLEAANAELSNKVARFAEFQKTFASMSMG
ncbi:hypothetical protein H696_05232 [Fonticula alba]|uniref:WH1 domain-containing protein n=1 Tax=Fonticula alba TaxID=691883 RepID=A0A058Z203_FONAL|nr:hypothetical protein H696_05232 [Fonticula alba]KCV68314.1 hypothetical protein H696_05232 [Fonticula alba]|eukprot:XP_009497368.1 hypothetical protein H696_05232 [Fonticula alba]